VLFKPRKRVKSSRPAWRKGRNEKDDREPSISSGGRKGEGVSHVAKCGKTEGKLITILIGRVTGEKGSPRR